MQSLLDIIVHPENAQIADASRVLQIILKDEINKIDNNFKTMANELHEQIKHTEEIKSVLVEQNNKLVTNADNAVRQIANMSQRLDNTVEGLENIVTSNKWSDIQHTTEHFTAVLEELLNKISSISVATTEHATQIQEQINASLESEHQINEQLQSTFATNTENMGKLTESANTLQQQLNELNTNVITGFEKSSQDYDETMHNNDKLLNDYLTKLSEFTKRANKELTRQVNTMTETANVVGANVRLAEASIDKQLHKLDGAIESLNNSTTTTTAF